MGQELEKSHKQDDSFLLHDVEVSSGKAQGWEVNLMTGVGFI